MIDALRFVQGAVATKDFVPELTHFRIAHGHIMGFNGRLALCSPIDLDVTAAPRASTFAKALAACGDTVSIHMTPSGRLAVRSGGFRVNVECIPDYAFDYYPTGTSYPVPAGFMQALEVMAPFLGEDASRPWCMGLHLNGGGAYATNNVTAVEYWLGGDLPAMTIPHNALRELRRLRSAPISIQTDGNSCTFWYGAGKWLRTQLIAEAWPLEQFKKIFAAAVPANCTPADDKLFAGVQEVTPFLAKDSRRLLLLGDRVSTSEDEETGAHSEVPGLPERRAFNADMLALVGTVATHYNLEAEPAFFLGDKLRGVIMGMNL